MRGACISLSWKVEWVFCEASTAKEGSIPDGIHVTDIQVSEGCLLQEVRNGIRVVGWMTLVGDLSQQRDGCTKRMAPKLVPVWGSCSVSEQCRQSK